MDAWLPKKDVVVDPRDKLRETIAALQRGDVPRPTGKDEPSWDDAYRVAVQKESLPLLLPSVRHRKQGQHPGPSTMLRGRGALAASSSSAGMAALAASGPVGQAGDPFLRAPLSPRTSMETTWRAMARGVDPPVDPLFRSQNISPSAAASSTLPRSPPAASMSPKRAASPTRQPSPSSHRQRKAPTAWGMSRMGLDEVPEHFWKTVAPDVHHEISEFVFDQDYDQTAYITRMLEAIKQRRLFEDPRLDLRSVMRASIAAAAAQLAHSSAAMGGVKVNRCAGEQVMSRLYRPDGTWSWQPATVVSAAADQSEFVIRWHANGTLKTASRLNVIFDGETEAGLLKLQEAASAQLVHLKAAAAHQRDLRAMPLDSAPLMPLPVAAQIVERVGMQAYYDADLTPSIVVQGITLPELPATVAPRPNLTADDAASQVSTSYSSSADCGSGQDPWTWPPPAGGAPVMRPSGPARRYTGWMCDARGVWRRTLMPRAGAQLESVLLEAQYEYSEVYNSTLYRALAARGPGGPWLPPDAFDLTTIRMFEEEGGAKQHVAYTMAVAEGKRGMETFRSQIRSFGDASLLSEPLMLRAWQAMVVYLADVQTRDLFGLLDLPLHRSFRLAQQAESTLRFQRYMDSRLHTAQHKHRALTDTVDLVTFLNVQEGARHAELREVSGHVCVQLINIVLDSGEDILAAALLYEQSLLPRTLTNGGTTSSGISHTFDTMSRSSAANRALYTSLDPTAVAQASLLQRPAWLPTEAAIAEAWGLPATSLTATRRPPTRARLTAAPMYTAPIRFSCSNFHRLVTLVNMALHYTLRKWVEDAMAAYLEAVCLYAQPTFCGPPLMHVVLSAHGSAVRFMPALEAVVQHLVESLTLTADALNEVPGVQAAAPTRYGDKVDLSDSAMSASLRSGQDDPSSGDDDGGGIAALAAAMGVHAELPFSISAKHHMPAVMARDDPFLLLGIQRLKEAGAACIERCDALVAEFHCHLPLLAMDMRKLRDQVNASGGSRTVQELQEWVDYVAKFRQQEQDIVHKLPVEARLGLFHVDCRPLQRALAEAAHLVANTVLGALLDAALRAAEAVTAKLGPLHKTLLQPLKSLEILADIKFALERAESEVQDVALHLSLIRLNYEVVDQFLFAMSDAQVGLLWHALRLPLAVEVAVEERSAILPDEEERFLQQIKLDRGAFGKRMEALEASVGEWHTLYREDFVNEYIEDSAQLAAALTSAMITAEFFNKQEEMAGWSKTDYSLLKELQATLTPYRELWNLAKSFAHFYQLWMYSPLFGFDMDELECIIPAWERLIAKLRKELTGLPLELAEKIHKRLMDFESHLPFIRAMRTAGMRQRHWMRLFEAEPVLIHMDRMNWTVQKLLKMEVPDHLELLQELAQLAANEVVIEQSLESIEASFAALRFDMMFSEDINIPDIYSVTNGDDICKFLDDSMMRVKSLKTSPYVDPHKESVFHWDEALAEVHSLMDRWLEVQGRWNHLAPLFGPAGLSNQLPAESEMFADVTALWQRIIHRARREMRVSDLLRMTGLNDQLNDLKGRLESIHKDVMEFLDIKRSQFTRFYFLSNVEMVDVLVKSYAPLAVEPYLPRCFPGIQRLSVNTEFGIRVEGVISPEGEQLLLKSVIELMDDKNSHAREVEIWMADLERQMRVSLRETLRFCIEAKAKQEFQFWVLSWPTQCVILGISLAWCNSITSLYKKVVFQTPLKQLEATLRQEKGVVVDFIRAEKLTALQRTSVQSTIITLVYHAEVTQSLRDLYVMSTDDFEWLRVMRIYLEGDVVLRCCHADLQFGHEYLGNTPRAVMTPLTERAFASLATAVHLQYGGAPEGPAGSSKAETVCELARCAGKPCIMFHTSEALDNAHMKRLLMGITATGAWACFDEFNRLDMDVLSVVAKQIITIQAAKATGERFFVFEGETMLLNPSLSFFITINPVYSMRSVLPSSLKALFRPISMMLPDMRHIAEVWLLACGYQTFTALASKTVSCLKVASDRLSSEPHYDWGMRALKRILVCAGQLRARCQVPGTPGLLSASQEAALIKLAIHQCISSHLKANDFPLFEVVVDREFPQAFWEDVDAAALDERRTQAAHRLGLRATSELSMRVRQANDILESRNTLILLGPAACGKTTIWRVLQEAVSEAEMEAGRQRVEVTHIFPKSEGSNLYDALDPVTAVWHDGVVTGVLRRASGTAVPEADGGMRCPHKHWMVMDGPMDPVWLEALNSAIYDTRTLNLGSGECIPIHKGISFILEVDSIAQASPATISHCGMVFLDRTEEVWRHIMAAWVAALQPPISTYSHKLEVTIDATFPDLKKAYMDSLDASSDGSTLPRQQPAAIMHSVLHIMDALVETLLLQLGSEPSMPEKSIQACLESCLLFSLMWAFEACLPAKARPYFNIIIRQATARAVKYKIVKDGVLREMSSMAFSIPLPSDASVFDFMFDFNELRWVSWHEHVARLMETTRIPTGPTAFVPFGLHNLIQYGHSSDQKSAFVFTSDNLPTIYLMRVLLRGHHHMVLSGPTGTGKTSLVNVLINSASDWMRWDDAPAAIEPPPDNTPPQRVGTPNVVGVSPLPDSAPQPAAASKASAKAAEAKADDGGGPPPMVPGMMDDAVKPPNPFVVTHMPLSSQSNALNTKRIIQHGLCKRPGHALGPPPGKRGVLFFDDVNCAGRDAYGSQTALELLRQWCTMGGWYDHEVATVFHPLEDSQLVGCMTTNTFKQRAVSERFLQHVSLITIQPASQAGFEIIFSAMLNRYMSGLSTISAALCPALVLATMELYREASALLLPVASRPHYTFSVRHVAQVFKGMFNATRSSRNTPADLVRLWQHECFRVFYDRIVDAPTRITFSSLLHTISHNFLKDASPEVTPDGGEVQFCTFTTRNAFQYEPSERVLLYHGMEAQESKAPETSSSGEPVAEGSKADGGDPGEVPMSPKKKRGGRALAEVAGPLAQPWLDDGTPKRQAVEHRLQLIVQQHADELSSGPQANAPLVIFKDAMMHVARVARILNMAEGHMVLLGQPGCGRRTLTRLAAHISRSVLFEAKVKDQQEGFQWRDMLKQVMQVAGVQGRPTCLLLSDCERSAEHMLDDAAQLISTGHISSIFNKEEMVNIFRTLTPVAKSVGLHWVETDVSSADQLLHDFFIERCCTNLHVVLVLALREHALQLHISRHQKIFHLASMNVIDEWDDIARCGIARFFLPDLPAGVRACSSHETTLCAASALHDVVHQAANDSMGRGGGTRSGGCFTATGCQFLTFLNHISNLLPIKTASIKQDKDKFTGGVDKMMELQTQLHSLQEQIATMQPQLALASENTVALMAQISVDRQKADAALQRLLPEEAQAQAAAQHAAALVLELDQHLRVVEPPLLQALRELKRIDKAAISELKSMKHPPSGIKLVMRCVCVMLGRTPRDIVEKKARTDEQIVEAWWAESLLLLGDFHFVDMLIKFDRNRVPDAIAAQMGAFVDHPQFNASDMTRASLAAATICRWVQAIHVYQRVKKVVDPCRAALAAAQQAAAQQDAVLVEARASLSASQERIRELEAQHEAAVAELSRLQHVEEDTNKQIYRAQQVISIVMREVDRWKRSLTAHAERMTQVVGEVLLCAGFLAYLGPATAVMRLRVEGGWLQVLGALKVSLPLNFMLADALGVSDRLSAWREAALPQNRTAIENAIIMQHSPQWVLVVDPQEVGTSFVRSFHGKDSVYATPTDNLYGSDKVVPKAVVGAQEFVALDQSKAGYIYEIIRCMEQGAILLLENIDEEMDDIIEQVLTQQRVTDQTGRHCLRIAHFDVEVDPRFKLFATSRQQNPKFSAEVLRHLSTVNFSITGSQLSEMLISMTLKVEMPKVEAEHVALLREKETIEAEIAALEEQMLTNITNTSTEEMLTERSKVLSMLRQLQNTSAVCKSRVVRIAESQLHISELRENVDTNFVSRVVPFFFVLMDLAGIRQLYQFSLRFFTKLFYDSLKSCPDSITDVDRFESLGLHFAAQLFQWTSRSLFAADKLPFAIVLMTRYLTASGKVSKDEADILLSGRIADASLLADQSRTSAGGQGLPDSRRPSSSNNSPHAAAPADSMSRDMMRSESVLTPSTPSKKAKERTPVATPFVADGTEGTPMPSLADGLKPPYLTDLDWARLKDLGQLWPYNRVLPVLFNGDAQMSARMAAWHQELMAPQASENTQLPDRILAKLTPFQRMLFMRCFQPRAFYFAAQQAVADCLGPACIKSDALDFDDLSSALFECPSYSPIVFIASNDNPLPHLISMSQAQGMSLLNVSMGRGQGAAAEKLLRGSVGAQRWVVLENCHLAGEWIQVLVALVAALPGMKPHPRFRLMITIAQTHTFPEAILQSSMKLVLDPPTGIKAHLLQVLAGLPPDVALSGRHVPSFVAAKADDEEGEEGEWSDDENEQPEPELTVKASEDGQALSDTAREQKGAAAGTAGTKKDPTGDLLRLPPKFRALILRLSVFHAVLTERQQYRALGWRRPYEFSLSDFLSSVQQLVNLRKRNAEALLPGILYILGQCLYGGKVSHDWDRRLLTCLLRQQMQPEEATTATVTTLMPEQLASCTADLTHVTKELRYISMPSVRPELVGLTPGAQVVRHNKQTQYVVDTLMRLHLLDINDGLESGKMLMSALSTAQEMVKQVPHSVLPSVLSAWAEMVDPAASDQAHMRRVRTGMASTPPPRASRPTSSQETVEGEQPPPDSAAAAAATESPAAAESGASGEAPAAQQAPQRGSSASPGTPPASGRGGRGHSPGTPVEGGRGGQDSRQATPLRPDNLTRSTITTASLLAKTAAMRLEGAASLASGAAGAQAAAAVAAGNRKRMRQLKMTEDMPECAVKRWHALTPAIQAVMIQVFRNELAAHQAVLKVLHLSLKTCINALKGLEPLATNLESLVHCLVHNEVPPAWRSAGVELSCTSMTAWIADLKRRMDWLYDWAIHGPPVVMHLGMLSRPHMFLTALHQTHAERLGHAVGNVRMVSSLLKEEEAAVSGWSSLDPDQMERTNIHVCSSSPKGDTLSLAHAVATGCLVSGLVLQGAHLERTRLVLHESDPAIVFTAMPLVWIRPELMVDTSPADAATASDPAQPPPALTTTASVLADKQSGIAGNVPCAVGDSYLCPVYRFISTHGPAGGVVHSSGPSAPDSALDPVDDSNDVLLTLTLAPGEHTPEHWVTRNVAIRITADPEGMILHQG